MDEHDKPEFWEASFHEKQEMWGMDPCNSAVIANDFFLEHSIKNVLIPGIGYGRNATIFSSNGMTVTGIEISETAIELLRKHYGEDMLIYHGSVTDMPFDQKKYDGIFCYALIHLLDAQERQKLVQDCYNQLTEGGYMIFSFISKEAPTYRTGRLVSKDRYEIMLNGVYIFFYDEESIREEFEKFGLLEIKKIEENFPFFLVICRKGS